MATDPHNRPNWRWVSLLWVIVLAIGLTACGTGPLVGIVYTNVKMPLTRDLNATPVPDDPPGSDRVIEIREPFTGAGIYTQVSVNAIGEIALQNGVETLYFADQEIFSILGIWKTHRVFLHGEIADKPSPPTGSVSSP
jgi:hypothetical protein